MTFNLLRSRGLMSAAFGAVGMLAATLVSAPASADTLADIKSRGAVRVAIDIAHPPYGMLNDQAQPTGLDVDTAQAIADDMGVKLEIVQVSGANRVPFLLSNQADIVVSSFSITEERKKVISYSEPYGVIPVVLVGPKDHEVKEFKDVNGASVAVARGTTADIELTRADKEAGNIARIVRFEDEATADTALQTGQHDFLVGAGASALGLIERNPHRNLEIKLELAAYPMAVGLRQNEPELQAWLDEWVVANLRNGRLNEIYKSYFGYDLPEEMRNR